MSSVFFWGRVFAEENFRRSWCLICALSKNRWMDRWMACYLKSFSTVFQSYQDDMQMIMESCAQWTPFTVVKISLQAGLKPGTPRSVGQHLTH